ncbi:serine hydrolase domain-containing protein [Shimazuella alba]|uniref:Serine hydrolase n=1 Tax=Shimazuella alba TaxID=2690964 RepID=A0A6I4VX09_9BACL|nr:serine hydrolase domain-containing protein [Shimazuella alba]MXQ54396.1 serine hydrolase [Shimazuella alba]
MKLRVTTGKIIIILLCTSLLANLPITQAFAKQNNYQTIDNYVKAFLAEHRIPGASIAILHNNKVFYSKEWGVTGSKKRVTSRTPFLIGSISKSLTGLAIMKLVEEKKIHLKDPVQKYIPWFTLKNQQTASQITIKNLLSHTSGISGYSGFAVADQGSKDIHAIKNTTKSLSNIELTASPGAKYQYSDANYLILGALIEQVTKQTFADYMEQNVFLPLGMNDAIADNDTANKKGYSSGYQSLFGIPKKSTVLYDNGGAPYGYIAASANDMVQYLKFVTKQHSGKILKSENIDLLFSPLVQKDKDEYYSFGWRITKPNSYEKMIWHAGSTPDSRSEIFFLPKSGWSAVILTNKNNELEAMELTHLKNSIINILNEEKPVDTSDDISFVLLISIGISGVFLGIFIYLIVKIKKGKRIHIRRIWWISSFIFSVFSIALIPLLIFYLELPWRSIKLFASDLALLVTWVVILSGSNSLLSLYISFKQYTVKNKAASLN